MSRGIKSSLEKALKKTQKSMEASLEKISLGGGDRRLEEGVIF